jgi:hypothetical protein
MLGLLTPAGQHIIKAGLFASIRFEFAKKEGKKWLLIFSSHGSYE